MVILAALRRRFGIEEGSLIISGDLVEVSLSAPPWRYPWRAILQREVPRSNFRTLWKYMTTSVPRKSCARYGRTPLRFRTTGLKVVRTVPLWISSLCVPESSSSRPNIRMQN